MSKPQSILITGGAGFIGSHLVDAYTNNGFRVIVIDSLVSGTKKFLPKSATFYKADVRDLAGLSAIFTKEKPDYVSHHAAQVSLSESVLHPNLDAEINIGGSLNVFHLSQLHAVKKVLFASSGGALYSQGKLPFSERTKVLPVSPYGIAKRSAELYLQYFSHQFGLSHTIFRYANVYGPRQALSKETGVIAVFCNQLLQKKQSIIFGDGTHTRDYVYVGDIVQANILATTHAISDTFNVGTGAQTSTNQLYTQLANISGYSETAQYATLAYQEQEYSALNYSKIFKTLGWKPQTKLKQGLMKTYQWYQEN